jgi:hypothetical protein
MAATSNAGVRPPLFKKGGQGGFYTVAHSFQSEHDYDTSYNAHRIMRKLFDDSKQIVSF